MSNQSDIKAQAEVLRLAYCAANQKAQEAIKGIANAVFGKVQVTKPIEYCDRGYECAAWSETRLSTVGVFDVYLRQDPYNKNRLFFEAHIPATVLRDWFPALFCGNMIGKNGYDPEKNAGKPCRPVIITMDPVKAITACTPEGEPKWAILPTHWECLLVMYRAMHAAALEYQKLAVFEYENFQDDKYLSKLGQTGYAGEKVNSAVKAIQEISRAMEYRATSSKDYFALNNPWAAAEQQEAVLA